MQTWSANYAISSNDAAHQETTFVITGIKLQVSVVTLSTQDSTNLLPHLKSG